MNKKEIESPKLTANFLVWLGLFVLLLAPSLISCSSSSKLRSNKIGGAGRNRTAQALMESVGFRFLKVLEVPLVLALKMASTN
jgi:hypothetical protein